MEFGKLILVELPHQQQVLQVHIVETVTFILKLVLVEEQQEQLFHQP